MYFQDNELVSRALRTLDDWRCLNNEQMNSQVPPQDLNPQTGDSFPPTASSVLTANFTCILSQTKPQKVFVDTVRAFLHWVSPPPQGKQGALSGEVGTQPFVLRTSVPLQLALVKSLVKWVSWLCSLTPYLLCHLLLRPAPLGPGFAVNPKVVLNGCMKGLICIIFKKTFILEAKQVVFQCVFAGKLWILCCKLQCKWHFWKFQGK